MNLTQDPWFVGLIITLVIFFLFIAAAIFPYTRDLLVLALAVPQALFKKVFGEPPAEDDGH